MCWSSFSRDRTSISAPSRGLIFIRSCSALRRDKSSGQQRTGSCSHGFISRCNSIILGVDGYRPNQMFRNECVLHVVGVVGVNVSFPSSCLPSSGRWRDLSQQTSVRWNSHRNANSCKQLFMLFLLWHWALSSCTFMSKTMLTLSEHLCVWPCFFCRETESSRFSDAVKTLSAKMNPLADIGEQLRKRMRQEEEQGPS